MRLDRYLADMTAYSRKELKEMIRKKNVMVNGMIVNRPETAVDINDKISLNGNPVVYTVYEYILLNKPAGVLTALRDSRYPVVMDYIKSQRKDLVPVGRLDKDTEGALLVTNDGQLNHRLLSARYHVDKEYYVETDTSIPENAAEQFARGLDLGDFTSLPAQLRIIGEREAYVVIQEGKYHQVKRMFEKVGCTVVFLRRTKFGPLDLKGLNTGDSRNLTPEEVAKLYQMTGLDQNPGDKEEETG